MVDRLSSIDKDSGFDLQYCKINKVKCASFSKECVCV